VLTLEIGGRLLTAIGLVVVAVLVIEWWGFRSRRR
jgi:hypothetical protein